LVPASDDRFVEAKLRARELAAVEVANRLAPGVTRSTFLRAVAHDTAPLDSDLWGPSSRSRAEALRLLAAEVSALRKAADAWITTTEAADLLDTTPGVIRRGLRRHHLVGLRLPAGWLLPTWQFTPLAESDVVPDLGPLQHAFPGDAIALSAWVLRDNVELGGRSPVVALLDGDTEAVIAAARGATAAAL
jgi:hypothetical protein